ncbi:MAG: GNAT family N-acetyltransferase [Anaerolineaceae bacterium]|nr:GNAT family N-acetyltransferase [Anaerolineaceae bacterium]
MEINLWLRPVLNNDLPIFFTQQKDPDANQMAAFTSRDPSDQEAFNSHWQKIMVSDTVIIRTIVFEEQVAGYVLSYLDEGKPEVGYWIGKEFWGKGIATRALAEFLSSANTTRPIYAHTAKDNQASKRVLEKCGFCVIKEMIGFANARGKEIEELLLVLNEF